MQGKNFCITTKRKINIGLKEKLESEKSNELLNVNEERSEEENKSLVRGTFMSSGSVTNPKNVYHLEIVFQVEKNAKIIKDILEKSDIESKILKRDKNCFTYLTEELKKDEEIQKILKEK